MHGGPPPQRPNGPRPPSQSDLLQQRAEQRRREQEQRDGVRGVLESVRGGEVDDDALNAFLGELTAETGALPPLGVVVEAMRTAGTDQVRAIGDEVRAYYRRPRQPVAPRAEAPPEPATV